jgi:hypothetical protein
MPGTFSLIANNANQSSYKTNMFQINLPGGGVNFIDNDKIRLDSLNVIYSWANITSAYNNNSFSYAINGTAYPVNIPDGFYSIADINSYLQSVLIKNGHYLVNNTLGINVYFISCYVNPTYYRIEFSLTPIPSTLPNNYSNPANVFYNSITFSNPTTPQIIIPNTPIQKIFGITNGAYPVSATTSTMQVVVSSFTPQVSPVQSLILRCNLVKNDMTLVSDVLFSVSPTNVNYGSNIYVQNQSSTQLSIRPGTYQSIQFTLVDQNYNDIQLLDPNVVFAVSITKQ